MVRPQLTHRLGGALIGLALLTAGCTTHEQKTPPLTGPSELSTAITISVSPDTLNQDGASQSLVTITARDANGQTLRNLPLRAEISVDGVITDFGRLSARNLVTDANGRATVTYTAPPPVLGFSSDLRVQIGVTPTESEFGNANTRFVTIRLVPPGVIGPPTSPFVPDFAPPTGPAGEAVTFVASVSGSSASAQVARFFWDFDDGETAVGQAVSHRFDDPGTYLVTLVVVDTLGRSNFVSKAVTVGAPTTVKPVFFTTPSAPVSGQSITFNASPTAPPAGHTISGHFWDFGDGTGGATGPVVTHTFASPGTYTVLLRVTFSNGAQATSDPTPITIAPPNPKAVINLSPPTGTPGQTITFLGNRSTPAAGRTIVNYTWNFGDGSAVVSGPTSTVAHAYGRVGTFTITLLVTDDQGNQDLATAQITIQ